MQASRKTNKGYAHFLYLRNQFLYMKDITRNIKQENIIDAAESVFSKKGFRNTKMDEIASEAGITKVTLYSYFQSKENLYLAITYRAVCSITKAYENTIEEYAQKSGLDSSIELMKTFMNFCEENFLYSEALLDYFSLVRSTDSGTNKHKFTTALSESSYFKKIQEVQNTPFKLSASQIERGQKDKSIQNQEAPMIMALHAWVVSIGFIKTLAHSGSSSISIFKITPEILKTYILNSARLHLSNAKFHVKSELPM